MSRHRVDLYSLVAGLVLVAAGAAGFAGAIDLDNVNRNAVVPAALLAVAFVLASTVWGRDRQPPPSEQPRPEE